MLAYAGSIRGRESDAYHIRWPSGGPGRGMSVAQQVALRRSDRYRQGPRAQRGHDRRRSGHRPAGAGRRHGRLQRRRGRQRHRREDHRQPGARSRASARTCGRRTASRACRAPSIILRDAISRANKIIYQTARTQPQCEGMGTTVVAALFFDNKITIAHVGDSRLYRLRGDKLEQVTHGPLAAAGTGRSRASTPPEEAQRAANKNYVTRALGVEPNVEVEIQEDPGAEGRRITCCARTGSRTWSRMKIFI